MEGSGRTGVINPANNSKPKVILVIGACCLDRLITVNKYPIEDSKQSSTSYYECCGGNAANVAITMSILADAQIFNPQRDDDTKLQIRLCTRIGNDAAGREVLRELREHSNLDLTSPLFQVVDNATTNIVHVLVNNTEKNHDSNDEQNNINDVSHTKNTRTCLFTPGTCGELSTNDIAKCDIANLLQDVIHIHTDGRHTLTAYQLIQRAKKKSGKYIPLSIDHERYRSYSEYEQLLQSSNIVFTNQSEILPLLQHQEELPANSEIGNRKVFVVMMGDQGAKSIVRWQPLSRNTGNVASVDHNATTHLSGILDADSRTILDTTGAGDTFIGSYLMYNLTKTTLDSSCTVDEILLNEHVFYQTCLYFGCWVSGHKIRGLGRASVPTGYMIDNLLGTNHLDINTSLRQHLTSCSSERGDATRNIGGC